MNIDHLKKTMDKQKISVADLAKKAKIGQSTVSEILSGVRKDVRLTTAKRIAAALNIKIEYLCEEE